MPLHQLPIVWASLLLAQVTFLTLPIAPNSRESFPELAVYALGLVGLAEAIGIVVFLRVALFGPIRRGELDPSAPAGAQRYFTFFMIAWSVAESIAIYGFLLRILGFDRAYTAPFAAVAALLFVYARPWGAHLRKPASSADLARSGTPIR
jgi:hypothetical protein